MAVERIGRWLKDHGLTCFMDRWYLVPGTSWQSALEQALQQSQAVAVFLGPGEMGRWQQRELHLALDRQAVSGLPVVPVLLPGSDPPLGFLSLNTWVDLRDTPRRRASAERIGGGRPRASPRPSSRPRTRPSSGIICPFRGLLPYREEDAPFFFGRQDYTDQLAVGRRRVTRSWPSWVPRAAASRPSCVPAWCRGCGPTRKRSGRSSPWCRRPDP